MSRATRLNSHLGLVDGYSKYAARLAGQPAARVTLIGNSVENLYSYRTSGNDQFGRDWPTFAMYLSSGRFQIVRNMGKGGETTTQFLARYDTDVTPTAPNCVVIGGAENDIQGSVALSTIRANVIAMIEKTYAIGAIPVLRTTMPHFVSNAVRKQIGAYNHWARNYGAENGIVVMDFWKALVNVANGQYLAAYSADGIHPNEAGSIILGQLAVDTLCAAIPVTPINIAYDPTDAGQLCSNVLWATDTAGTPTGCFEIGGNPAGSTRSMVSDGIVPGRWARLTAAATAAGFNTLGGISTGATAGDVLEVSGYVTTSGGLAANLQWDLASSGSTFTRLPMSAITGPITRGFYKVRFPPFVGAFSSLLFNLGIPAGTGYAQMSYPTIRNLTAEGIV